MLLNAFLVIFNFLGICKCVFGDIAILGPDNRSIELFIDYKITYTPSIPDEGIIGRLVRASPTDACSSIEPPPSDNQTTNWFVLADRSTPHHLRCSNRDKVQYAAQAGYKAIILYSPVDGILHTAMTFYTTTEYSNITIPAVLVSHEDGEALRYRYLYKTGYLVMITSDLPPNLSYYLLPFAIVIGVCLLLTLSFMVFQLLRCYQERRKAMRYRLSKKYLKKLHLKKFEKGIYYETCAICLDDYIEGEKIRILPCNHAYHSKCIDPWLTKTRRVCPVCKAKVRLPGMPESSDSDSENDNQRSTNERTRLISGPTREIQRSVYGANRTSQSQVEVGSRPSTSRAGASSNSTSLLQGPLDDTISQPGSSTPATNVSVVNISRNQHKKKSKRVARNVQVVAEIEPLIAPSQHSINFDEDVFIEEATSSTINLFNPTDRSNNSTRTNKKNTTTSVDQIV